MTTRTRWSKTAVYFLAFIALGLASAVLGPTLPGLADNTGRAVGAIGFLFTVRSLGFLIGALLGGRLYDRLPGHWIMGTMLAGLALTLALVPMMRQIWGLTAVLFLIGFVESLLDVGGNTLIVWLHGKNVGPYMNGMHFFFGVGAFLSPAIVALALERTAEPIQWAYWLPALIILPMALPMIMQERVTAVTTQTTQNESPINKYFIGLLMVFFFLYVGAEIGFGGWVFTYVIQTNLASETIAAYITSAFWGALTVGRLFSIPIATKLQSAVILKLDLVGALISVAILLLWSDNLVLFWIGTIGLGLFLASMFPTMLSLAGNQMKMTGKITGWLFVGSSLGAMSIPWLAGVMLEAISPQAMIWIVLISLFITWGVLMLILRQSEKVAELQSSRVAK